jgi:hypothetical protein
VAKGEGGGVAVENEILDRKNLAAGQKAAELTIGGVGIGGMLGAEGGRQSEKNSKERWDYTGGNRHRVAP